MSTSIEIGTSTDWVDGWIDPDAAAAYAVATNDPNEIYRSGLAVPPLYTASIVREVMVDARRAFLPDEAIAGTTGGVAAEHQVVFHRPLLPCMAVKTRARIHSARQTPAGALTHIEIDICDLDEHLLRRHYWANMQVGGTLVEGPVGPQTPDHTFSDESRQRHSGTYGVYVDPDQGFRYAGVSGDRPPHSISDEMAKLEGYPGKILQGLCTFGLCSGGVVEFGADGDPSRLRHLAARFARPCTPRHDLVVEFYDAGRTGEGHQRLAFEAVSDGVTVIKHGLAVIDAG